MAHKSLVLSLWNWREAVVIRKWKVSIVILITQLKSVAYVSHFVLFYLSENSAVHVDVHVCVEQSFHMAPILHLTYDVSSTLLASASSDRTVKVWDTVKHQCTNNLRHIKCGVVRSHHSAV